MIIYVVSNIAEPALNMYWFYKIVDAVRRRVLDKPSPSAEKIECRHSHHTNGEIEKEE